MGKTRGKLAGEGDLALPQILICHRPPLMKKPSRRGQCESGGGVHVGLTMHLVIVYAGLELVLSFLGVKLGRIEGT